MDESTKAASETYTGTLLETCNGYFAQFSNGGGKRKGTLLRTCRTEAEADRRKLAIAKLIACLRQAGQSAMVPNTIREAGALDADGMRKLERLVERIASGKEPTLAQTHDVRAERLTVTVLAEMWTLQRDDRPLRMP